MDFRLLALDLDVSSLLAGRRIGSTDRLVLRRTQWIGKTLGQAQRLLDCCLALTLRYVLDGLAQEVAVVRERLQGPGPLVEDNHHAGVVVAKAIDGLQGLLPGNLK